MMLYNVKVIEYPNGTQSLRYYKNPVILDKLDEVEKEKLKDLREIEKMNRVVQTPFGIGYLVDNFVEEVLSDEEIERKALRSLVSSMNRTINKIYDLARCANWEWFVTLTFDDKKTNAFDYKQCRDKVSDWLKYIRKNYAPDLQYLFVPELHPSSGRWHFHGLLSRVGNMKFSVARNNKMFLDTGELNKYYLCELRTSYPDGDYIFNLTSFKGGFSTATKIKDSRSVSNYMMKYITKDLCVMTPHQRRYIFSRNLEKPLKYCFLYDKQDEFRSDLEHMLVDESKQINYSKTVNVNVDNYENVITYYEIN